MRISPNKKYHNLPCSYVGVGCAYEDTYKKPFTSNLPLELKDDGYLSLDAMNRYIRQYLPIQKKQYFKRVERIPLKNFLNNFKGRAGVCVYGHFIYVNDGNYWSFFDNDNDPVVCVWYIKE